MLSYQKGGHGPNLNSDIANKTKYEKKADFWQKKKKKKKKKTESKNKNCQKKSVV